MAHATARASTSTSMAGSCYPLLTLLYSPCAHPALTLHSPCTHTATFRYTCLNAYFDECRSVYRGGFIDGDFGGYGAWHYADGGQYNGPMVNGLREGQVPVLHIPYAPATRRHGHLPTSSP